MPTTQHHHASSIAFAIAGALIIALAFSGCATGPSPAALAAAAAAETPPMPPLSVNTVPGTSDVQGLSILPQTRPHTYTVLWDNLPSPFESQWGTVVYLSYDLRNWQEVAVLPYSTGGSFTLTNDAPAKFLRVSNVALITNSSSVLRAP